MARVSLRSVKSRGGCGCGNSIKRKPKRGGRKSVRIRSRGGRKSVRIRSRGGFIRSGSNHRFRRNNNY